MDSQHSFKLYGLGFIWPSLVSAYRGCVSGLSVMWDPGMKVSALGLLPQTCFPEESFLGQKL